MPHKDYSSPTHGKFTLRELGANPQAPWPSQAAPEPAKAAQHSLPLANAQHPAVWQWFVISPFICHHEQREGFLCLPFTPPLLLKSSLFVTFLVLAFPVWIGNCYCCLEKLQPLIHQLLQSCCNVAIANNAFIVFLCKTVAFCFSAPIRHRCASTG